MPFTLSSSAFAPGADIPPIYTADGQDRSPPLAWSGAPDATKSYALIVDDPDAPSGDFVHWVMFNIPATTGQLPEDTAHSGDLTDGSGQGTNDFNRIGYGGPKPPPGKPHRYRFHLYALDQTLQQIKPGATRDQLERAMQGHVLAEASLTGCYASAA